MEKCEHTIGIEYNYDDTGLITFKNLVEHINHKKERNKWYKESGYKEMIAKEYTLEDYFDKRKSKDIDIFNYCPDCGKKLELKDFKN